MSDILDDVISCLRTIYDYPETGSATCYRGKVLHVALNCFVQNGDRSKGHEEFSPSVCIARVLSSDLKTKDGSLNSRKGADAKKSVEDWYIPLFTRIHSQLYRKGVFCAKTVLKTEKVIHLLEHVLL